MGELVSGGVGKWGRMVELRENWKRREGASE